MKTAFFMGALVSSVLKRKHLTLLKTQSFQILTVSAVVKLIGLKIWKVNPRNTPHFFKGLKEMLNEILYLQLQKIVEQRLHRK